MTKHPGKLAKGILFYQLNVPEDESLFSMVALSDSLLESFKLFMPS